MNNFYKLILTLTFPVILVNSAYSQDEDDLEICSQNLEEALLRYDEGKIQDVEGLLQTCLDDGAYDKAQSVQALRLMILSYIFMGEEGKADSTMLTLLQTQHEFIPDQALDPVEFINLYGSYRTDPIFRIGVKFGPNMTAVQATKIYATGQPGGGEFEYSTKQGITAGILFEYEFSPRWNIYPEFLYATRTFDKSEEFGELTDPANTEFGKTEVTENHTWVEMPISVQYRFLDQGVRPYVNLGGSVSYLISAEYPSSDNRYSIDDNLVQNTLGDVIAERNRLNFYVFLGGGVKLKIGEGFFVAELRVNYGLTEIFDGEKAFSPDDTGQIPQRIIPDAYKTHFGTFTIGYTQNFYKPKKL